jgi:hypothetical protein
MSFKEWLDMDENKWNGHGGDRSGILANIKRSRKINHKPYMGYMHHAKRQKKVKIKTFVY